MKNVKNMHKIIEKDCFLAKTFIGKETKKDQERQKKGGGALIGAGAHIRDNTVFSNRSFRPSFNHSLIHSSIPSSQPSKMFSFKYNSALKTYS